MLKNARPISVILVGNEKKKTDFCIKAGFNLNLDHINVLNGDIDGKKFLVFDLIGTDNFDHFGVLTQKVDAVIYIDATEKQKNIFEIPRLPIKCIAIDFESTKSTPTECLKQISKLSYEYVTSNAILFHHGIKKSNSQLKDLSPKIISYFFAVSGFPASEKKIFMDFPKKMELIKDEKKENKEREPSWCPII